MLLLEGTDGTLKTEALNSLSPKKSLGINQSNCKYCDLEPLQCYKINSGEKYIYNGIDRVNNTLGYTEETQCPAAKRAI